LTTAGFAPLVAATTGAEGAITGEEPIHERGKKYSVQQGARICWWS
jgi:hypothetical protein